RERAERQPDHGIEGEPARQRRAGGAGGRTREGGEAADRRADLLEDRHRGRGVAGGRGAVKACGPARPSLSETLMPRSGARAEQEIATFTKEVCAALGEELICLALHGSAAGDEWVAGRSDINTALVVPRVTFAVLERLAPLVARWRQRGFALPVVMDYEYLRRARSCAPSSAPTWARSSASWRRSTRSMRSGLALALGLLALALPALAAEPRIPAPEGFVTDRAGVIPPATRERLTALLEELKQK